MIATLSALARRLIWLRPIVLLLGIGFFSLFVYALVNGNSTFQDFYLIPSLLGVIWVLLFNTLISIFPNIPPKPRAEEKFFSRIKLKFKRGFYGVMAVIFILLTALVIFFTVRMLGLWKLDF